MTPVSWTFLLQKLFNYSKKKLFEEIHFPNYVFFIIVHCVLYFRYDYDGIFEATPGCRRAVRTAIEAAEKNGIKVIPFRPFGLREAFKLNSSYRGASIYNVTFLLSLFQNFVLKDRKQAAKVSRVDRDIPISSSSLLQVILSNLIQSNPISSYLK